MEHEEVIGAVADGQGLGDGDGIVCGEGLQEVAFLGSADDGVCWDELTRQGLCCGIDFQL